MPRKTAAWSRTSTRPELFRILKEEHKTVKDMFMEFERVSQRNDMETCASLAMSICAELEGHTQREEQIVYPQLKEQDEEMFFEATEEHTLAKGLITQIKRMQAEDDEFKAKVKVLKDVVEHHIEEEESEVFSELRELPADTLRECAASWKEAIGQATRATTRSRAA